MNAPVAPEPPPVDTTPVWRVDHFQINGAFDSVGEAAIILLIDSNKDSILRPDPQAPWHALGEVRRAILIDGGQGPNMLRNAVATIAQIERDYGALAAGPPPRLQFDAVIITHWDKDHYKGFCYKNDSLLTHKRYGYQVATKQVACFKYDTAGKPLTTLYCQFWEVKSPTITPGKVEWNTTMKDGCVIAGKGQTTSKDALVEFDLLWRDHSRAGQPRVLPEPIARCIANPELMLGKNLFTGRLRTVLPAMSWRNIKDIEILAAQNNPADLDGKIEWPGAPAYYIVGCRGYFLGGADIRTRVGAGNVQPMAVRGPHMMVIDEPFTPSKLDPNEFSIMSMLVWKHAPTGIPMRGQFRISMYNGGDSEWLNEAQLVDWLAQSGHTLTIDVMKIGHHGSKAGTSIKLIQQLNPSYYLMSAGYQFGHPTHFLLNYLDAWFRTEAGKSDIVQRFHSLCYPYWLGKVFDKNGQVRYTSAANAANHPMGYLDVPGLLPAERDYRTQLKKLYDDIYKADPDANPLPKLEVAYQSLGTQGQDKVQKDIDTIKDKIIETKDLIDAEPDSSKRAPLKKLKTELEKAQKKRSKGLKAYVKGEEGVILFAEISPYLERAWKLRNGVLDYRFFPFSVSAESLQTGLPEEVDSVLDIAEMLELRSLRIWYVGIKVPDAMTDFQYRTADDTILHSPFTFRKFKVRRKIVVPPQALFVSLPVLPENGGTTVTAPKRPLPPATPSQFDVVLDTAVSIARALRAPETNISLNDWLLAMDHGSIPFLEPVTVSNSWTAIVGDHSHLREWFDGLQFEEGVSRSSTIRIKGTAETDFLQSFQVDLAVTPVCKLTFDSSLAAITSASHVSSEHAKSILNPQGLLHKGPGLVVGLTATMGPLTVDSFCKLFAVDCPFFIDSTAPLAIDERQLNMIWFYPTVDNQTTMILNAKCSSDKAGAGFNTALLPFKYCDFTALALSGRRTWTQSIESEPARAGGERILTVHSKSHVGFKTTIGLRDSAQALATHCELFLQRGPNGFTISLRPYSVAGSPAVTAEQTVLDIVSWIGAETGIASFFGGPTKVEGDHGINARSWLENFAESFAVREVLINVTHDAGGWSLTTISLTLEAAISWGVEPSTDANAAAKQVPLRLTLTRTGGKDVAGYSVVGSLWPPVSPRKAELRCLDPEQSLLSEMLVGIHNPQYFLSIPDLFEHNQKHNGRDVSVDKLPKAIHPTTGQGILPTRLSTLSIVLGTEVISLRGAITSKPYSTDGEPHIALDSIHALIEYDVKSKIFDFSFAAHVYLHASTDSEILLPTADLSVSVTAVRQQDGSSNWSLSGSVEDLTFAHLGQFMHLHDREALVDIMKDIKITALEVDYHYGSHGLGSNFNIHGMIEISDIDLDFTYTYETGPKWQLFASVKLDSEHRSDAPRRTIGTLLSEISSDIAHELPPFLDEIELSVGPGSAIALEVSRETTNSGTKCLVFSLSLHFEGFSAMYLQVAESSKGLTPQTKRLLRMAYQDLPKLRVPTLPDFPQPFGAMELVWVSDDLLRLELDLINQKLTALKELPLAIKDPRTRTSDIGILDSRGQDFDLMLRQGCHIIITDERTESGTALLDYHFGAARAASSRTLSNETVNNNNGAPTATARQGSPQGGLDGGASPLSKTIGPLSISAIAVTFDEESSKLQLTFTAKIRLGPLEGILEGFGVRFPITSLKSFDISTFELLISGAGFEFTRKPISVAGMLYHRTTKLPASVPNAKPNDEYFGGLAIEVDPYNFLAGGYYGNVTDSKTKERFESMFVFAKLDGPFAELEFAELSGLTAGFGYHSDITLPNVSNVTSFPFIAGGTPGSDALQVLDNLIGAQPPWFTPSNGPLWLAAGLTAKLFQALTVSAVLIVDIKPDDVILGIYAECTATLPADVPQEAILAEVDLGIAASLDFGKGTLIMQGGLTPKSYILSRNCRLRGGFALCYWFTGSGHDGDWVFSIGGYHPAFSKPEHYPSPRQLGIDWTYDSTLSIHGGAYLAVTPKCAMAGLAIDMIYASGRLNASLHAFADLLLNYNPLYFTADVGVHVKASVTLGWDFLSHTFHVDMDATLRMHGPPVAGVAHINWEIFKFDVHFGDPNIKLPDPLSWPKFKSIILQRNTDDNSKSLVTIKSVGGLRSDASGSGQNDVHTEESKLWLVNNLTFVMRVDTLFPINRASVNGGDPWNLSGAQTEIYMKPMHVSASATSTLNISVVNAADTKQKLAIDVDVCVKDMPSALWEKYDPSSDPMLQPDNSTSSLLSPINATRSLMTGLYIYPPAATEIGPEVLVHGADWTEDCYSTLKTNRPPSLDLSRLSSFSKHEIHPLTAEEEQEGEAIGVFE
ncbi:hypothetical protein CBER1_09402 [Cercospora berteroae]|uniref:DUF6603 domain-containing protein n=1 Tax=Cercospora berteroae TaxID=357750 RepID=A0A2S6CE12_9PEZI|nr:hypothetical protein CBER1_09402 [Cercospora berteroae]